MEEGDVVSEKSDPVPNGSVEMENNTSKAVLDKEVDVEHPDGVKEIELDKNQDGLKEIEVDKPQDGVKEIEVDKPQDRVKEIEVDNHQDGVKDVELDKYHVGEKEIEENRQHDGKKEIAEDVQHDEVKEMEEDKQDDVKLEAQDIDMDKGEVSKSCEVESAKEGQSEKNHLDKQHQEIRGEVEDEEMKNTADDMIKEEVDGMKEESNQPEPNKGNKLVKRSRKKSNSGKNSNNKKIEKEKEPKSEKKEKEPKTEEKELKSEKEEPETPKEKVVEPNQKEKEGKISEDKKEPKTPATFSFDRPVRERKSVERLVAVIEQDYAKELRIEKGRGTVLQDIPNVAFKLGRKKTDETLKLLHVILFGRRGKAAQVKSNILRFSGFVWHDNEEKQIIKVKEKLDKCIKEKLIEFCDVFDIPISRANSRKEDIITKLFEFLMEPHATSSELLPEKDQSSKGKKRKRGSKPTSGSTTPSIGSPKSRKKSVGASKKSAETKGMPPDSGEDNEVKNGGANEVPENSDHAMSEHAASKEKESDSEEESDKDKGKQKRGSAKSSSKKGSDDKAKTKNKTVPKKAGPPPNRAPAKSPPSHLKSSNRGTANKSSGKKKDDLDNTSQPPKKSEIKESAGKKILKVKEKLKEERVKPSDDKLRDTICKILKEADFNTATFTDILKLLGKQFNMDLTPRKSSIKAMIQDELTKLAEADDEEEDEGKA